MCSKDCPTIGEMWASNNLRTITLASHWSVKASHWKCIIVYVEKYLQTSFDPFLFLLFSIFLIFLCLELYFYPWNIFITHLEHAPFSSSITSHLFFRVHNNVSIPTLWKMFTTIVPRVIRENVPFPLLVSLSPFHLLNRHFLRCIIYCSNVQRPTSIKKQNILILMVETILPKV